MNLKQQIDTDLISALKSKDEITSSSLRMLKSAIKNKEIALGKDLLDSETSEIISKEIKQRKDSAEQYSQGERKDLANKELEEIEILSKYLPKQMSETEIINLVKEAIEKTKASELKDIGKVMGVLMPQIKGKADGSLVSKIVKSKLK